MPARLAAGEAGSTGCGEATTALMAEAARRVDASSEVDRIVGRKREKEEGERERVGSSNERGGGREFCSGMRERAVP